MIAAPGYLLPTTMPVQASSTVQATTPFGDYLSHAFPRRPRSDAPGPFFVARAGRSSCRETSCGIRTSYAAVAQRLHTAHCRPGACPYDVVIIYLTEQGSNPTFRGKERASDQHFKPHLPRRGQGPRIP